MKAREMMRQVEDEASAQPPLSNPEVSDLLQELADLLEAQNANVFRVRAYRTAADTVRALSEPVHQILASEGLRGLTRLPGIGESLARSIERLTLGGRLGLLERLRGDSASERVFTTVPGIGMRMAALIHDELGIETLAELEIAAYDGRLARVPGMGQKRIQGVRDSLAGRFRRRPRIPMARTKDEQEELPPVSELLSVDEEYRCKAGADRLLRIAPHRFNPTGEAWLPILHTHREDRHYTALYSNTVRAHDLGTTRDWVVVYRDDHGGEGQWTIVTSQFGKLKGRRIVRGREKECHEFYAAQAPSTSLDATSKVGSPLDSPPICS